MWVVLKMIMRTNGQTPKFDDLIHQYLIIAVIVTVVIADNKTMFKCPGPSQWKFRAKSECNDTEKYICLFDENGQKDEEFCGSWPDFENPGYKQILLGGTTVEPCSEDRYQPFIFWTNGSSKCVFKKESCNQEGQVIHSNGTLQANRICRCDYTKNYDFAFKPKNGCFCIPSEEDCSCYMKPCHIGYSLSRVMLISDELNELMVKLFTSREKNKMYDISKISTYIKLDYECLKESKLKYNCPEIYRDSSANQETTTTILSSVEHVTPAESVAWSAVIVTCFCISAVCVLLFVYHSSKIRNSLGLSTNTKHLQSKMCKHSFHHGSIDLQTGMYGLETNEVTSIIPYDMLVVQEKEIGDWRKRLENFVETHASKTVLNTMKTHGFVIISGPPGSGKSAIAYNTALMLQMKDAFRIMPVTTPEEIRKYLLPKTRQVFLIDDPVGKYTVDDSRIQRWKNEETFIKQTFTDCLNTKLVLTCRSYIYKSGFSHKFNFSPIHCDLLSHNFEMTVLERENVYHRYAIPVLNEETIKMYGFFPLLCALYSTHDDTTMFFVNPCKVLTEEMKNMRETSDTAYLALALLVVQDNNIERQLLSFENQTIKELLNDMCNECGFKYFPSTAVLLAALHDLIETYVKENDNGFACIHNTLFQNLSFIVGSSIINCLLRYANSKFIANRLQLVSIQQDHDELVIMVKPEQEELYFQRLLMDIRKGYHSYVFTGIQMKYSLFRSKLLTFIKRLKAEDLTCDENNSTPLHVVSENGYNDLIFTLVQIKKNQINVQDKNKRTPLFMACSCCHSKVLQTLLVIDNSSLNVANEEDLTLFDVASINDDVSTLKILLQYDAKVNRTDKKMEKTALHRACENGSYNAVMFLLSNNADVKHKDKNGLKAIHIACTKGHIEIVELLLKHDRYMINERDKAGKTPLFTSCENNQQHIVKMLLTNKANVNKTTIKRTSPLHKACKIDNENIVALLLDYSAKVNVQSENGFSPLHIACLNGKVKIVQLLLDKNAEVNVITKQGWTPFYISCSKGFHEIRELLLTRGANIKK